jgi:glycosyltransferase involved in cell wall biosynthesis
VRILLITPMPPRAEAGGAIPLVLNAQLIGLRERHHVTLVTAVGGEPGELAAVDALRADAVDVHPVDTRSADGWERRRRRVRLASTWLVRRHPWRTVWFADPRIQRTIDTLVSTQSFDVAAATDNALGVLRFPRGLPTVLEEYEVRRPRPVDWRLGPPRAWPSSAFREADWSRWRGYQRRAWRRFDRIQVTTREDAALVADIAPALADRVAVNPFAIEVPPASDPARERPGMLLFTGNFTHPPNVDAAEYLARDVMPRIASAIPEAVLFLVGNEAERYVGRLSRDGVAVVDSPESMRSHLDAAAVVLVPVRTGGGMRMKVLQALASGKAVVTSSRGARGFELGEEDPPFLVADDTEGIADAAVRLLGDRELRLALGRRARDLATRNHSPAAYAHRLEQVYGAAIEAAARR